MSFWRTTLLGLIAGGTIFLGLPLGRLRNPRPGLKAFLNASSAGILIFLLFDILQNATRPVERVVEAGRHGQLHWGHLAGLGSVYVLGLAAGLLSLLYLGKYQRARRVRLSLGPGAMAVTETSGVGTPTALQLGMS